HRNQCRMVFRDFRKKPVKKWTHHFSKNSNHATLFANFHNAQCKRPHATQTERYRSTISRTFKKGIDNTLINLCVATDTVNDSVDPQCIEGCPGAPERDNGVARHLRVVAHPAQ